MNFTIRHILIISLAFWMVSPMQSQQQFVMDSMPQYLKQNAGAVIRSAQYRITLLNNKQSRLDVSVVVTLLNDKADALHRIRLPYDKFRRISRISARAYGASGQLIWNLKKFNIADRSDFTGPDVLSDAREKVFEVPSFNYPFTIAYDYTMKMEDLFLSPDFHFQPAPGISVQETGVACIIPEGLGFRHKSFNLRSPSDSVFRNGRTILSWKETNLPAYREDEVIEPTQLPVLYATPLRFEQGGYQGGCSTWQEYGNWILGINAGLDVLDSTAAERTKKLVMGCKDRSDTMQVLYSYLQKNTHYFYTGLGIGGTRPIPAAEVAKFGYGDCKALSNYMKAMLKTVGIESWYTLVKSGKGEKLAGEIPCSQFDHVILCVPGREDTIWLECTNPTIPFGFLGSFTCDRDVLAITPEGGKLLHTPVYGVNENRLNTRVWITFEKSGNTTAEIVIQGMGLEYEELFSLSEKSKEEQHRIWSAWTGCPVDVISDSFHFDKNILPSAKIWLTLKLYHFAPVTSNRQFINPVILSSPFTGNSSRFRNGFQQTDSLWVELPDHTDPEFLPENTLIESKYGFYQKEIRKTGNKLLINRHARHLAGTAQKQSDTADRFRDQISVADGKTIVLKTRLEIDPGDQ